MAELYWQVIGEGKTDLVLLHGWGLNAEVWRGITARLSSHFRLHLLDLPGYGRSNAFAALSLSEMAALVQAEAPDRAVWLGWSLGGLVASRVALDYPNKISTLITLAHSPCFVQQAGWPGVKPEVLTSFQQQLSTDYQRTVERFLLLQTLGTEHAREDARTLRETVLSLPEPSQDVLSQGLALLAETDLREELDSLTLPFYRLYGVLDALVPKKAAQLLDQRWPGSASYLFANAAHAPFISHPELFCEVIEQICASRSS